MRFEPSEVNDIGSSKYNVTTRRFSEPLLRLGTAENDGNSELLAENYIIGTADRSIESFFEAVVGNISTFHFCPNENESQTSNIQYMVVWPLLGHARK